MTNYLSNEYGLLIPRRRVRLKPVDGDVQSFDSAALIFEKPVVITASDDSLLEGIASGHRSVLTIINGMVYKIKGCAIEKAFNNDGLYRRIHNGEAPKGGVIFNDAKNELLRTRQIGNLLTRAGFCFPYEPQESFLYRKQWVAEDVMPEWFRRIDDWITELSYAKQLGIFIEAPQPFPLGAAVMKIMGDTRLPEIYLQREKLPEAVSDIAYKFGLSAGAQMRVANEYYWGRRDAHVGNYVVFLEGDNVYIAMVDFEEARPVSEINMLERLRYNFWQPKLVPRSVWQQGINFRKKENHGFLRRTSGTDLKEALEKALRILTKENPLV
ncbi:MAG: hypothetical protein AABX98_05330 [Nanoarchaeota archaeon]